MNGQWLTQRTGLAPTAAPPAPLGTRSILDEAAPSSAPEPDPRVTFTGHSRPVETSEVAPPARYRPAVPAVRRGGVT